MIIDAGEWLPDQPDYKNPGCTVAQNVIPAARGYRSFPSAQVFSDALTGRPIGSMLMQDNSGNIYHFAGDPTKLYVLNVASWLDVSGQTYTINTDDRWSFSRFGNRAFASNIYDGAHEFNFSTQKFAAVSAIPKARHIAEIKNFLVCANIFDSTDGYVPNRVHWSGLGLPTSFPTIGSDQAVTEQSDRQDITGGRGGIRRIVGGQYGTIFFENTIYRMTYIGGKAIFRFDEVGKSEGTRAPDSVIVYGNRVFYLGTDGFKMFDGQQVHNIGSEKVDRTFLAEYDPTHRNFVSAAIDYKNKNILWAVPTTGHTGRPNKIYVFSLKTGKWSYLNEAVEMLLENGTDSTSLEDLDATYTSIEDVPYSLDSEIYIGGDPLLSAFKSDKKLYNYDGTDMAGLVETAETELFEGQRADLNKIAPLVDGGTVTIQVGTRARLKDAVSWGSALSESSDGEIDVLENSKYYRFRINTTGAFNSLQGVEIIEAFPAGRT